MLKATEICVCGQREHEYGSPENNFADIAKLWSIFKGVEFTAHDIGIMMALLKIARIKDGQIKDDNYVDGAGYLACACEIATKDEVYPYYDEDGDSGCQGAC